MTNYDNIAALLLPTSAAVAALITDMGGTVDAQNPPTTTNARAALAARMAKRELIRQLQAVFNDLSRLYSTAGGDPGLPVAALGGLWNAMQALVDAYPNFGLIMPQEIV